MSEQSFESFYNKAKEKAEEALKFVDNKKLNKEKLRQEAVLYFYKNLPESEKNLYENIAVLDETKRKILDTQEEKVKLSIESLTKNIINHPEITLEEYFLIFEIVNKPELLIFMHDQKDQTQKLLCFANKKKYYAAIIKSTEDKQENFLQSFHITDLKRIEALKNRKGNKIIHDFLTQKKTVCREDSDAPSVGV